MEGPDTVAAVFLEPVQNSGGCFPPPPGYFQRVREICDRHDVLLVSDEVICAFGRLGHTFACDRYGYQPDMITCAKGMTSGYSPIGATIASERIMEPFLHGDTMLAHGFTFGGHPVSAAVALANLDLFESEDLLGNVLRNEDAFRSTLEKLLRPPDRRRRPRRRVLLRDRAREGQGHEGELRRRRVRAPAARLPVACAVRLGPALPGRRPRRPGDPARAAAHLRPVALRRDRAHPADHPHRGVVAGSDPPSGGRIGRTVGVCDVLCALGPATADGVTRFAKNSDRPPDERQVVEWHPPRREATTRTTYLEIPARGRDPRRPRLAPGVDVGGRARRERGRVSPPATRRSTRPSTRAASPTRSPAWTSCASRSSGPPPRRRRSR